MEAVIIKKEDYETLPFALCNAIWETSKRSYGITMISRETKREIDQDTMVGLFITTLQEVLENAGEGEI